MVLSIVTCVALPVPINAMARNKLGAGIHAVLESRLSILIDNLGTMALATFNTECLKGVSVYIIRELRHYV